MAISMRLSPQDEKLIRTYAELHGLSISDFARNAMIEKIEDEIDIKAWQQAMEDHMENQMTHTHEEVGKMLGLK